MGQIKQIQKNKMKRSEEEDMKLKKETLENALNEFMEKVVENGGVDGTTSRMFGAELVTCVFNIEEHTHNINALIHMIVEQKKKIDTMAAVLNSLSQRVDAHLKVRLS